MVGTLRFEPTGWRRPHLGLEPSTPTWSPERPALLAWLTIRGILIPWGLCINSSQGNPKGEERGLQGQDLDISRSWLQHQLSLGIKWQPAHTRRKPTLLKEGYAKSSFELLQFQRQGHFHSPFKNPLSCNSNQTALGWSFPTHPQRPFPPGSGWWEVGSPCISSLPGNEAGLSFLGGVCTWLWEIVWTVKVSPLDDTFPY